MKMRMFKKSLSKALQKQHHTVSFDIKSVDESGEFVGIANKFDVVDLAYDITRAGCFKQSIELHKQNGTMPKLLPQHDWSATPIGIITDMWEDTDEHNGLMIKGRFDTETPEYRAMKSGALDSFSIGYRIIREEWNDEFGANELLAVHVEEVSVVTRPANPDSKIVSVKKVNDDIFAGTRLEGASDEEIIELFALMYTAMNPKAEEDELLESEESDEDGLLEPEESDAGTKSESEDDLDWDDMLL